MKKIILSIAIVTAFIGNSVKAQQAQVATLHSDGSVTTQTLPLGKMDVSPNLVSTEGKHSIAHHEAILLPDGSQEIHYTDASGKVTKITAKQGESVQKKYLDYLEKNHLPCACGSVSSQSEATKTVTLSNPKRN
jgi:hypothetical protein